jgi:hypothetical protein
MKSICGGHGARISPGSTVTLLLRGGLVQQHDFGYSEKCASCGDKQRVAPRVRDGSCTKYEPK